MAFQRNPFSIDEILNREERPLYMERDHFKPNVDFRRQPPPDVLAGKLNNIYH